MKKMVFAVAAVLLAAGIVSATEDVDAVIDFEGLAAGTSVDQANATSTGGPVGPVIGEGGQAGATYENSAFQHNLLIIDETLIDDDSDALDNLLEEVVAPALGDNGVAQIGFGEADVGISGVDYMLVDLGGSGAIDNIVMLVHQDGFCGEGCTPGYWKQAQHFGNWTGYASADSYSSVFGVSPSFGEKTLLGALKQGGGGEKTLGRHAVAALLSSSNGEPRASRGRKSPSRIRFEPGRTVGDQFRAIDRQ